MAEGVSRFRAALAALEEAAGEPVLSGDVDGWCGAVRELLGHARAALPKVVAANEDAYAQILEAHVEFAAEVDRLRATDAGLAKRADEMDARLGELAGGSGAASSDEPVAAAEELRERLLAWVVRARAHEKEVERWLVESALRDTGSGD